MSAGMEFPAEAVGNHAGVVSDTSEEIARARTAVGAVTMDSQAYGQFCQFLPTMLSPLFGIATEAMDDAVEALAETALKLHATASDMTATDTGSARGLSAAAATRPDLPL